MTGDGGTDARPAGRDLPLHPLRADPRFGWCGYLPSGFAAEPGRHRLLLAIHGSEREAEAMAASLAEVAEAGRYAVLAPLFPTGVANDGNADGYKYLAEPRIDYVAVIDAMVAAFEAEVGHAFGRLCVLGFSGGAQCAHRYALVRPERVVAASVAAPGTVTLPGRPEPWWVGTGDMAARFGHPLDVAALRRVRFQLLAGADDLDTSEILPRRASRYATAGADLAGATRVDRLLALAAALDGLGVAQETAVVPGAGHELGLLLPRIRVFLLDVAGVGPTF